MKTTVIALLLTFGFQSLASEVACPTTIQLAVSAKLAKLNRKNEKAGVPQLASAKGAFQQLAVFRVDADSSTLLPSRSSWLVVVKSGPMGTCQAVAVIQDRDVQ
jgi:hypothetical protein